MKDIVELYARVDWFYKAGDYRGTVKVIEAGKSLLATPGSVEHAKELVRIAKSDPPPHKNMLEFLIYADELITGPALQLLQLEREIIDARVPAPFSGANLPSNVTPNIQHYIELEKTARLLTMYMDSLLQLSPRFGQQGPRNLPE